MHGYNLLLLFCQSSKFCLTIARRAGQGENDPYVSVHVGGEVQKTSTVQGGGAEPLWGEGVSEMRAMIVCICRGISVVHGFSDAASRADRGA